MAYSFNGSTDYFEHGFAPITVKPVTMAVWFYRTSGSANLSSVTLADGDNSTAKYNDMWLSTVSTDNSLRIRQHLDDSFSVLTGSVTSLNQWQHHCGIFASSGNSSVFLNGSVTSGALSTSNPSGIDNLIIGAGYDGAGGRIGFMNGYLAEVALWDIALSSEQVASLAKGFAPRLIAPQSLKVYVPFRRQSIDLVTGTTLTAYGSPAAVNTHPPMFY